MYERSYQARHIRENLLPSLAPETARESDSALFGLLRRSSLRCDELAPTEASAEDIARWHERQDVQALHRSNDPKKLEKIRSILLSLDRLQTLENRAQFFKEANTRRALGESTEHMAQPGSSAMGGHLATSVTGQISALFKQQADGAAGLGLEQEALYIDLLLKYMDGRRYGRPTCFLCRVTFGSWEQVWKHSNKAHGAADAIWPLDCPECQRQGKGSCSTPQIASLGSWCAHVHEHYAPDDKEPFRCLLGCRTFARPRDLATHLEKSHPEFWDISDPVPCPECERLGLQHPLFTDAAGL